MTAATKEQAWEIPTGLSRLGRKAAVIIRDFCRKNGMDDTGGCKVFYTPKQWQERSEPYGCETTGSVRSYPRSSQRLGCSWNCATHGTQQSTNRRLEQFPQGNNYPGDSEEIVP
jgi:hypothetical protein